MRPWVLPTSLPPSLSLSGEIARVNHPIRSPSEVPPGPEARALCTSSPLSAAAHRSRDSRSVLRARFYLVLLLLLFLHGLLFLLSCRPFCSFRLFAPLVAKPKCGSPLAHTGRRARKLVCSAIRRSRVHDNYRAPLCTLWPDLGSKITLHLASAY